MQSWRRYSNGTLIGLSRAHLASMLPAVGHWLRTRCDPPHAIGLACLQCCAECPIVSCPSHSKLMLPAAADSIRSRHGGCVAGMHSTLICLCCLVPAIIPVPLFVQASAEVTPNRPQAALNSSGSGDQQSSIREDVLLDRAAQASCFLSSAFLTGIF